MPEDHATELRLGVGDTAVREALQVEINKRVCEPNGWQRISYEDF